MSNKTKTPRTDADANAIHEIDFLLCDYRSDSKERWKPAYDALVKVAQERNRLKLETIQLNQELDKKEQELHSITQLCRPTPLSIGHPIDYVKWLREDRDRKANQLTSFQVDKERLDWLEEQIKHGESYCEIYLSGLRWMEYKNLVHNDTGKMSDAQMYQIEANPSTKFKTEYGNTLRQAIDSARTKGE